MKNTDEKSQKKSEKSKAGTISNTKKSKKNYTFVKKKFTTWFVVNFFSDLYYHKI